CPATGSAVLKDFWFFLPALFPVIVDCCTEVAYRIPRRWLRTVAKFNLQKGGDLCKISAVILHTKDGKVCISAENRHVKRWMKRMAKGHRRTRHRVQKTKKAIKRKILNK
uniref:Chemokine interleukin-8-like domain-containing protein n=1 Tax=Salvator merianae TaxID=96440 RepID=A0A8D0KJN7_SALMN